VMAVLAAQESNRLRHRRINLLLMDGPMRRAEQGARHAGAPLSNLGWWVSLNGKYPSVPKYTRRRGL